MTLKEKVAEVMPYSVSDYHIGGVEGCPDKYKFLNATMPDKCYGKDVCTDCWNREYKELPDERD